MPLKGQQPPRQPPRPGLPRQQGALAAQTAPMASVQVCHPSVTWVTRYGQAESIEHDIDGMGADSQQHTATQTLGSAQAGAQQLHRCRVHALCS